MCVIIVKEKGCSFPDAMSVKNCCDRNPEGFSMAWNEGGMLKVFKTMSARSYLRQYAAIVKRCNPATTGLVMHMRIATHGSKTLKNCHCWTGCGYAFAHNGVLSIGNYPDMTDSETFFRKYFEPAYEAAGWNLAEKVIELGIGTSKFAFIDKEGDVKMFGTYLPYKGNLYSNHSYEGIYIWDRRSSMIGRYYVHGDKK